MSFMTNAVYRLYQNGINRATQCSAGRDPRRRLLEDAGTSQSRQSLLEMEQFGSSFAQTRAII